MPRGTHNPIPASGAAGGDEPLAPGEQAGRENLWFIAVVVALALVAGTAALNPVWTADAPTHVAAGRWMLDHGRVLDHDPFAVRYPADAGGDHPWVNVHWLFQLGLGVVHAAGGFHLLSVAKAVLAAGLVVLLALALRRRAAPAWIAVAGLVLLASVAGRLRVRPEIVTLLLLLATILLLDSVRRGGSPRRLWGLAPLFLLWVNLHGLYILGPILVWAALVGSAIDRRLGRALAGEMLTRRVIAPLIAAHLVCFVSPWPLQAAVHPLRLWARISGRAAYYRYGVAELGPSWTDLGDTWPMLLLAAAVLVAMRLRWRRVPLAHAGWFVAFAVLGALAQRNLSLTGLVFSYLLAVHGAALWRAAGRRWRAGRRAGPALAGGAVALALAVAAANATEWSFRALGQGRRFGTGVAEDAYPLAAARFLQDLDAPGDIYCANWGDAGAFLYAAPRRRVYMDGRLELHSLDRFLHSRRLYHALRLPESARRVALPSSVRFIVVGQDETDVLQSLPQTQRFRLIYVEPNAAVFARRDGPGGAGDLPAAANLGDYDTPLEPTGAVGPRAARRRRWYRQNVLSLHARLGELFTELGYAGPEAGQAANGALRRRLTVLGVRYFEAARLEGLAPRRRVLGRLAGAYQQLGRHRDVVASLRLPADLNLARALRLYEQADPSDLATYPGRRFALERIRAMLQDRQLDAAEAAIGEFLDHLRPRWQLNPPGEILRLQNDLAVRREQSQARLRAEAERSGRPFSALPLARRVGILSSPDVGLIDRALGLLDGPDLSPPLRLVRGDLLLRQGRVEAARQAYEGLRGAGAALAGQEWMLQMRLALCDAVEGRLFVAATKLGGLAEAREQAAVRFYHAAVLELLGRHAAARQTLRGVTPDDPALQELLDGLRADLAGR